MSLSPVTVRNFGGLRADADPLDLGYDGATAVSNVVIERSGSLRSRAGYTRRDSNTLTTPIWLAPFRGIANAINQVVLVGSGDIRAYNATTLASALTSATPDVATHGIEFNNGGNSRFYIADLDGCWEYDGVTVNTNQVDAKAKFLAVQPIEHRLVFCYAAATGGTANPSRVYFTDPDSDAFSASNWVDIAPQDGTQIRMALGWGNELFVFKDRSFAVFYGNSVDSGGDPIFNYRMVGGIGCAADYAACAARDGIYFFSSDGIYRTTGAEPVKVSQAVQSYFDDGTVAASSNPRLVATADRLHVFYGTTSCLVLDFETSVWTHWTFADEVDAAMALATPEAFLFVDASGRLHEAGRSYSDDNGTSIAGTYASGYADLGDGARSRVRRCELRANAALQHATRVNGSTTLSDLVTVTALGNGEYVDRRALAGDFVSFYVAGTGQWQLQQWTALVADRRVR